MTNATLQKKCKELYDAMAARRELDKLIDGLKADIDLASQKEDFTVGPYLGKYINRVEDYIRGKNATALKTEHPDLFEQYGGATSESRTLRLSKR